MIIKWITIFLLLGFGIYLIAGQSSRHIALRRLGFVFFVSLSLINVFFESFIGRISSSLGVGSGTELLVYLTSFAFIGYVVTSYRSRRVLENRVTELARHIALEDFERSHNGNLKS